MECGVTFLCDNLSSTSTAHCAVLMNYLRSLGHPVNLITEERPHGNEFRHDHTIRTFSIDTPIRFSRTRDGVLSDIAKLCEGSLFILFTSSTAFMCDDAVTLKNAGHKVVIFEDMPVLSLLYGGSASLYRRYLDTLATVSSVVTTSVSAFAHLRECGIGNAVYVPYLFPFTNGEFSENEHPDSIALIFKDKTIPSEKVKEIFRFVKNESSDSNLIVKGLNENDFDKDERISFTSDDCINFIDSCSNAMLFYGIPYIDDVAVDLSARMIPFKFFSAFNDESVNTVTLDKLSVPTEKIIFTLDDQAKICEKYSVFFESIMSGNTDYSVFPDPEYSNDEFSKVLNELRGKHNYFSVSPSAKTTPSALKKLISLPNEYFVYRESKRYAKYKIHQTAPDTVRKCQLLALYMLDEFERICKKHSLRYYVAAGSLLGAVRHGGMIPWDDDIDVTMPRPDYEAFLKIARSELSDDMILPIKNFPYGFTRIMMKDTKVNRIIRQKGPHGVFLDVLPLDGAAPDEESANRHAEEVSKLLRTMLIKALPIPRMQLSPHSAVTFMYRFALKCIPKGLMMHRWNRIANRYSTDTSDCLICLPGTYGYEKECFPKEYWGEPVMMMYNGTMRPVMKEWEAYLTLHYGDYMRTPALLLRRTHGSLSIDLGKYADMSIEELENHLNQKRKEAVTK